MWHAWFYWKIDPKGCIYCLKVVTDAIKPYITNCNRKMKIFLLMYDSSTCFYRCLYIYYTSVCSTQITGRTWVYKYNKRKFINYIIIILFLPSLIRSCNSLINRTNTVKILLILINYRNNCTLYYKRSRLLWLVMSQYHVWSLSGR